MSVFKRINKIDNMLFSILQEAEEIPGSAPGAGVSEEGNKNLKDVLSVAAPKSGGAGIKDKAGAVTATNTASGEGSANAEKIAGSGSFWSKIMAYFTSFKTYITTKFSDVSTTVKTQYEKMKKAFLKLYDMLKTKWNELLAAAKDPWKNSSFFVKTFVIVGVIALVSALIYLTVKPDIFMEAANAFSTAFSNISSGIKSAFSENTLGGMVKGIVGIFLAPVKILFEAIKLIADSGIGDIIILCFLSFGAASAFMYYQLVGSKAGDSKAPAPATTSTAHIRGEYYL